MSYKFGYIYSIYNKINGHFYIGSTHSPDKRKATHFNLLRKNKHHSRYLQHAFNKYGEENFEFKILLKVNVILREAEQLYIDKYKPEYNVSKNTLAPMQGRKHSKETIKKFKEIIRPKGKDCPHYGKKQSEEQKEKQRQRQLGSKRSEETKKKMRETAIRIKAADRPGFREAVLRPIIDNNDIIYSSLTEAAKITGCSIQAICDNLKGRSKKTRTGLTFKYVEKNNE